MLIVECSCRTDMGNEQSSLTINSRINSTQTTASCDAAAKCLSGPQEIKVPISGLKRSNLIGRFRAIFFKVSNMIPGSPNATIIVGIVFSFRDACYMYSKAQ